MELGNSFVVGEDPPPSEAHEQNSTRGHTETLPYDSRRVSNHPWDQNNDLGDSFNDDPLPNLAEKEEEQGLSSPGCHLFEDKVNSHHMLAIQNQSSKFV